MDFEITQTTFRRRRSEVIIYKHSQSLIILSRFQFSIKCIFIFSPLQFQCDFSNTMNHFNNQCLLLQSIWMIFNQILTSFNFLFKKNLISELYSISIHLIELTNWHLKHFIPLKRIFSKYPRFHRISVAKWDVLYNCLKSLL